VDPTTTPYFPAAQPNLATQLQTAGIPWRSYQAGMGTACRLSSSGAYTPRHDPFLYFSDVQQGAGSLCTATNVDYSSFSADLAANTYRYLFITPDLNHDGYEPSTDPVLSLQQSDAWCATEVAKILTSTAFQQGGVLFLTWDEALGRNGDSVDKVPMIIISNNVKAPGYTSSVAYSHKSYLATVEDILGLPRLSTVTSEQSMLEFFQ
jgi:hypothetical protein